MSFEESTDASETIEDVVGRGGTHREVGSAP
jgi:hypothetical protein